MPHKHRLTIDADGFQALVGGEPVTGHCACGEPVAILLHDIGYLTMIACIQEVARGSPAAFVARRIQSMAEGRD